MKKVHVFAVLVLATGLLYSCGSDDPPSSAEILGQGESSSSSALPSGTAYCRFQDGTCTSSPLSEEACLSLNGLPVQSCGGGSSSSVAQSSSSVAASSSSEGVSSSSEEVSSSSVGDDEQSSSSSNEEQNSSTSSNDNVSSSSSSDEQYSSSSDTGQNSSSSSEEPSSSSATPSSSSVSGGLPTPTKTTFVDSRDGQTYNKVTIGTQTWMAENLNYEAGGSCYIGQEASYCETYGRLYDWNTAMNNSVSSTAVPSGIRGVCPEGWHLPSEAEWGVLMQFVNPSCPVSGTCANAGTKLKAKNGWNSDGNGTDEYGFSALPGGYRDSYPIFSGVGNVGRWWSTTDREREQPRLYPVYGIQLRGRKRMECL